MSEVLAEATPSELHTTRYLPSVFADYIIKSGEYELIPKGYELPPDSSVEFIPGYAEKIRSLGSIAVTNDVFHVRMENEGVDNTHLVEEGAEQADLVRITEEKLPLEVKPSIEVDHAQIAEQFDELETIAQQLSDLELQRANRYATKEHLRRQVVSSKDVVKGFIHKLRGLAKPELNLRERLIQERIRLQKTNPWKSTKKIAVLGAAGATLSVPMYGAMLAGSMFSPFSESEADSVPGPIPEVVDDEIVLQQSNTIDLKLPEELGVQVVNTKQVKEVTENTKPDEFELNGEKLPQKSILKQIIDKDISIREVAGRRIDTLTMSIPGLCLDDIHLYGSNFAPIEDVTLQQEFFIPSGLMSQDEADRINNKTAPYAEKASIYERFDPTYRMSIDSTPQEACEAVLDSSNEPRWDMLPTGSYSALDFATAYGGIKLAQVQPVAEIELEAGILPGQTGNMVVAAHNRTQSGAFWNIDALSLGEEIIFTDTENGENYVYVVEQTAVVDPSAKEEVFNYSSPTGIRKTVTLYGCQTDQTTGISMRQVVFAVMKEEA